MFDGSLLGSSELFSSIAFKHREVAWTTISDVNDFRVVISSGMSLLNTERSQAFKGDAVGRVKGRLPSYLTQGDDNDVVHFVEAGHFCST